MASGRPPGSNAPARGSDGPARKDGTHSPKPGYEVARVNGWLLLLSAGLGLRHGAAPDHLAAVTTFVEKAGGDRRRRIGYALRIGLGHVLGMAFVAVLALLLLNTLPNLLRVVLGRLSALWLLFVGAWILWDLGFGRVRGPDRGRVTVRRPQVGLFRHPLAAWCVGLLLGLAVAPGDLAILTLAMRFGRDPLVVAALLSVFWLAMLAVLCALAAGLAWSGEGLSSRLQPWLSGASGVFGIVIGVALLAGILA